MFARTELGQFIWIVGATVFIAVPLILQKIRLPRRLQVETLADNQLTGKQREFLAAYDSKLKELGHTPFMTYNGWYEQDAPGPRVSPSPNCQPTGPSN